MSLSLNGTSRLSKSELIWQKALTLIPGGTMTESKKPSRYVNGIYPKYIATGHDCMLTDLEGREYVDFISGLGAIILGYGAQVSHGVFSLPYSREVDLAALLKDIFPSAEMSKFFKTGSEACSAAIKCARAYTGRDKVLVCGYHGWHDWYSVINDKTAGIPKFYASLIQKIKYNDLDELKARLNPDVAAFMLEPVIYEMPNPGYLQAAIDLCHKNGTIVVFDEVVTGLRFPGLSAQKFFSATPDMSCFGKAIANGVPMAVVCGKREIMDTFSRDDFFCSGTYNSDAAGIIGALSTIGQVVHFYDKIEEFAVSFKTTYNELCAEIGVPSSAKGFPMRTYFDFPTAEHKSLFWQECVKRGILFGYANFPTLAHATHYSKSAEWSNLIEVLRAALLTVKENWGNPLKALKGEPAKEVFRLIRR